jgi:hypothetical protein
MQYFQVVRIPEEVIDLIEGEKYRAGEKDWIEDSSHRHSESFRTHLRRPVPQDPCRGPWLWIGGKIRESGGRGTGGGERTLWRAPLFSGFGVSLRVTSPRLLEEEGGGDGDERHCTVGPGAQGPARRPPARASGHLVPAATWGWSLVRSARQSTSLCCGNVAYHNPVTGGAGLLST